MAYDRHANYWNGLPERDQATILGYLATYIDAFAFLYQKTQRHKYEEWARKLLLAFQSKSNDGRPCIQITGPNNKLGNYRTAFIPRPLHCGGPVQGVRAHAESQSGLMKQTAIWRSATKYFGFSTSARTTDRLSGEPSFVDAAIRAYLFTGKEAYLRMAVRVGEDILKREQPHAQMASTLADRLNALRRLYEVTADPHWLEGAERFGNYALATFVHSSGLIRGTAVVDRPDYYDAIQGPGTLALALYKLGELKVPGDGLRPVKETGDTDPPVITDLKFPKLADNRQRVPVSMRISDTSGVKRATLYYTYGNEIAHSGLGPGGFVGGQYTFHIDPPGLAFQGEAFFAVEALDASPNVNRAITPWNHLLMASYERQEPRKGSLRFAELGLDLEDVTSERSVQGRLTRVLPEGTSAPSAGWVSTGHYACFEAAALHARQIEMTFAPEDSWRLIGSTLALAYWSGTEWQRVPSKLDLESNTVRGDFHEALCWTLVGEDRVLWRAPGRQGVPPWWTSTGMESMRWPRPSGSPGSCSLPRDRFSKIFRSLLHIILCRTLRRPWLPAWAKVSNRCSCSEPRLAMSTPTTGLLSCSGALKLEASFLAAWPWDS